MALAHHHIISAAPFCSPLHTSAFGLFTSAHPGGQIQNNVNFYRILKHVHPILIEELFKMDFF